MGLGGDRVGGAQLAKQGGSEEQEPLLQGQCFTPSPGQGPGSTPSAVSPPLVQGPKAPLCPASHNQSPENGKEEEGQQGSEAGGLVPALPSTGQMLGVELTLPGPLAPILHKPLKVGCGQGLASQELR